MVMELRRLTIHFMRPHPYTPSTISRNEPIGVHSTGPGVDISRLPWTEEVRPCLVNLTRLEGLRRDRFWKIDYALTGTAVVHQYRRCAGHHIVRVSVVNGEVAHV